MTPESPDLRRALNLCRRALEAYLASEPLNRQPNRAVQDSQLRALGRAHLALTALKKLQLR